MLRLALLCAAAAAIGCSDGGARSGSRDARADGGLGARSGSSDAGAGESPSPDGAGSAPSPEDSGTPTNDLSCGPCRTIAGLDPCCTPEDECGAMYLGSAGAGCVALDQDGQIDPSCPTPGDQPAGCCLPSGVCGAFYTRTFGCVPHEAFPGFAPEPVPCGTGVLDAATPDAN